MSLPADAVVLSADEAADLSDRVYQVRCAAEDVATALDEGAGTPELRELCVALMQAAKAADGVREIRMVRGMQHSRSSSAEGCSRGLTGTHGSSSDGIVATSAPA